MKRIASVWLLASLLSSSAQEGLAQPPALTPKIHGRWILTSHWIDGKLASPSTPPLQVSFVGNKCVFGHTEGTYVLRDNRNPNELDLNFVGGDGKPYTLPGICDRQGDALTLC